MYCDYHEIMNVFQCVTNLDMMHKHPAVSVTQNPSKRPLSYVNTHMLYYHYFGVQNYKSDYGVLVVIQNAQ